MIAGYPNSPHYSSLRDGRIVLSEDYPPGSTFVFRIELNDPHTKFGKGALVYVGSVKDLFSQK